MREFLCKCSGWAYAVISAIISFLPESFFSVIHWKVSEAVSLLANSTINSNEIDVVVTRVLCLIICWGLIASYYYFQFKYRKRVTIKGQDYTIRVEEGNILQVKNCKKVISFDECYTTKVGNAPQDINEGSICGQYLQANPIPNMQQLIAKANVNSAPTPSRFNAQPRYKSGTIVPRGNDLLLAFAPLNEDGLGQFPSIADYMESLSYLWRQLDKYCGQKDICIPILGSGVTRFNAGTEFYSQQELLDLMIISYKKSPHKLKANAKLRIICKQNDNFSLNKIGVK